MLVAMLLLGWQWHLRAVFTTPVAVVVIVKVIADAVAVVVVVAVSADVDGNMLTELLPLLEL